MEGGGRERPFSQPLTSNSDNTIGSSVGRGDMWLPILLRQLVLISSRLRGTAPTDSSNLTFLSLVLPALPTPW